MRNAQIRTSGGPMGGRSWPAVRRFLRFAPRHDLVIADRSPGRGLSSMPLSTVDLRLYSMDDLANFRQWGKPHSGIRPRSASRRGEHPVLGTGPRHAWVASPSDSCAPDSGIGWTKTVAIFDGGWKRKSPKAWAACRPLGDGQPHHVLRFNDVQLSHMVRDT